VKSSSRNPPDIQTNSRLSQFLQRSPIRKRSISHFRHPLPVRLPGNNPCNPMRLPQVREHGAVRHLPVPGHRDRDPLLDRLHELGAEPADLRVLQPRLPRSVQEHPTVRFLLALQTGAVRSRGAGLPPAIPQVRSGLTHRGTHSVLSLLFFSDLPVIVAPCRLLYPRRTIALEMHRESID